VTIDQNKDYPAEPLITTGAVTAAVAAALMVAVSFGLHLTRDQVVAIGGLVAAVAPLVAALVGRSKVFSKASVAAMLRHQTDMRRRFATSPPPWQQSLGDDGPTHVINPPDPH
jgi:uncharacterized membrane protein